MQNVAFIGCGNIARIHARHLQSFRGVRIVTCADVIEERAASFASEFATPRYCTDFRKMLRDDAIDTVWVCTPTSAHRAPVVHAARAGKHVFVEKPMALKLRDGYDMAEACERHGVKMTIGFCLRFDGCRGKLKELVQKDVLGRPVFWRSIGKGKQPKAWMRDVNVGGGPFMDLAVHNYDSARQVFGPVESVQASSMQLASTSVGHDTGSVILNFASGDQHTLVWTWGVDVRSLNHDDLVGPKGVLEFGMTAQKAPKNYDPARPRCFTFKKDGGDERLFTYRQTDYRRLQDKNALQNFARNEQPLVTPEDGIEALKIAVAVLKSGRQRKTIRLS